MERESFYTFSISLIASFALRQPLFNHLAVFYNRQGRYAHYIKCRGKLGLLINIDFADLGVGKLLGSSSIMGETILQGPHHDAQKSRSTGLGEFNTSCSKFSFVIVALIYLFSFLCYLLRLLYINLALISVTKSHYFLKLFLA